MMEPVNDPEQDEFLVSQYIDGTLEETARRAFEQRLATEPDLAKLLLEFRAADAAVGAWGEQTPEVNWSRFETDVRLEREWVDSARGRWRVIYKLSVPLAAAASIVFAFVLWGSAPSVSAIKVTEVSIGAPAAVPLADSEMQVAYGHRATQTTEDAHVSVPKLVIAMAGVGEHVRWPAIEVRDVVN